MYQSWHDLLFMHWAVDPKLLQQMLPDELEVDTFEGKAYIALVPFRISQICARGLKPIPGFRKFLEINVRTYVHCRGKNPGVWFFSLDAENPFACIGARLAYKLPYFFAEISQIEKEASGHTVTEYRSARYLPQPLPAFATIDYSVESPATTVAAINTIDHFFVERYLLYSYYNGVLFTGQVHHRPYELQRVNLLRLSENLTSAAGVYHLDEEPIVHFSRRADVEVFPIRPTSSYEVN